MPEIKGLKGLLYNQAIAKSYEQLLCPPYDVISDDLQRELYQKSEYNAVRLELPIEENRYDAAAARFVAWQAEGALLRDAKEAIYPYFQTFTTKSGEIYTRKGLIALCRLYDFSEGKVVPHERTLSGPKADRLNLFKKTEANFSCIFGLYSDTEKTVDSLVKAFAQNSPPMIDALDSQSVQHQLWRMDDESKIEKIQAALQTLPIYIADGHHRYETGVQYRNLRKDANPEHTGNEPYNYIMMYIANMHDEGMVIFPTHRLVHSLPDFSLDALLAKLRPLFELTELPDKTALKIFMEAHPKHAFGMIAQNVSYGISLKVSLDEAIAETMPNALKSLDVTILHHAILGERLGLSQESQARQTNLIYSKDVDEVFEKVASGAVQLGFVMNATSIHEVVDVASVGEVMPQKSTYFYPKLATGLVFNALS
ncbi:conserved hypothetical protein [Chloroherpeton thalassium ATCC 35110]|uniref:DUF1015 domain-containing protein n=1 Tax=Chloroherpeton thalassium (strain ATCC 35110 / GB-78) TaxID=517418 RepID=B3QW81_CHLT3|nr:DUF1015 domain-containing protein [Chloroherpeton thalassium]ACF13194.1 conserved hypothetical protein [Chloroherpeton thalassium ATCC 35110]